MKIALGILSAAAVLSLRVPSVVAQPEDTMGSSQFVVMPHMKGSLALQTSSISSLWYVAAGDGRPAQLRVNSPALSEAKTVGGDDADALWATFHDGALAANFVFVTHIGGTLAIPRSQIRSAYYAEDSGAPRLRLMYDGDQGGKSLEGAEATRVWTELRQN